MQGKPIRDDLALPRYTPTQNPKMPGTSIVSLFATSLVFTASHKHIIWTTYQRLHCRLFLDQDINPFNIQDTDVNIYTGLDSMESQPDIQAQERPLTLRPAQNK
jgi:hypothetical protein